MTFLGGSETVAAQVVFVIGGDRTRRQRLARVLGERHDVRPVSMAGGEAALAWVHAARPAVIVVDLGPPAIDTLALVPRLRDSVETRTIPVVAIGAPEDADRAAAAGCAGFVADTASPVELADAIGTHLRRPSVRSDGAIPADRERQVRSARSAG